MSQQYTANLYCKEEKIISQTGDNIDELYAWMLSQVNQNAGDVHGEIIDNNTNEIVRTCRKSYSE